MTAYAIGGSGQRLIFGAAVVEHFNRHRQLRFWQCEAGGQLFARFDGGRIEVVEATGPRPTDRRTRTSYTPDPAAEQREIDARFPLGLHFVGDWHTHPEDWPSPSGIDRASTASVVRRSTHELNAFVAVVVGRKALHVSLHDGNDSHVLTAEAATAPASAAEP